MLASRTLTICCSRGGHSARSGLSLFTRVPRKLPNFRVLSTSSSPSAPIDPPPTPTILKTPIPPPPPPPDLHNDKRPSRTLTSTERNFITPVRAMQDFLLKSNDLAGLRKTMRRSPHADEPPISVYWRRDVEQR